MIRTIGAKGAGESTVAEGATICAEGADEGEPVGDSSIVTIVAPKVAGESSSTEGATAAVTTNTGTTDIATSVTTAELISFSTLNNSRARFAKDLARVTTAVRAHSASFASVSFSRRSSSTRARLAPFGAHQG